MKYLKKYNEGSFWYQPSYEVLDIINDLKNSDVEDIVLPITDKELYIRVSKADTHFNYEDGFKPKENCVVISIWYNRFNYLDIKDDVEFLLKYIQGMGYQTHIYAYDSEFGLDLKNIDYANSNLVDQIDIYINK